MVNVELILPKMGESVAEATITSWLKSEGDIIEAEESVVEIATDKVDSEVPSPADGIISKILVAEGEIAQVGQAIAIISTEGAAANPVAESPKTEASPTPVAVQSAPAESQVNAPIASNHDFSSSDRFYSPLVKNIAQEEGIPVLELDQITGSGQSGRVTKNDILSYISTRGAQQKATITSAPQSTKEKPAVAAKSSDAKPVKDFGDDVEIIEMDRMRKLIAGHMINSKATSPHVTSFVETDVTNIVNWRNKNN